LLKTGVRHHTLDKQQIRECSANRHWRQHKDSNAKKRMDRHNQLFLPRSAAAAAAAPERQQLQLSLLLLHVAENNTEGKYFRLSPSQQ